VLVEDPTCPEGGALDEAVRPLELAADVGGRCAVDMLVLFEPVWRWDAGYGGELAVIGDLRSIASL